MAGDVDVNSGKFAVTASDGSLAISSNKFTVAGDTGNTVVAGTLNATGAATLSSTLDVAGDVDVNSGKFAVTASDGSLAISSNKFTVAGDTGNTVVAGTLNATGAATLSSTLDVAGDVDVNGGKFAVTASDGSLAISSNKFTVAGDTGNTVVAGTLNATGAATLSSTLDVAGDVDVNSGKFAVTASDGSLAISSNKFTVAGDTGNTVVAGTLNATGAATLSSTLDVAGDVDVNSGKFAVTASDGSLAISSNKFTVAGDTGNTVVAGTLSAGAATLSSTLDVAGDVDVNSGKFAVTASDGSLAISSNKFTVAGDTGNTVVAGTLNATGAATLSSTLDVAGDVDVNSGKFAVTASDGSLAISSNKFTVAGDTGKHGLSIHIRHAVAHRIQPEEVRTGDDHCTLSVSGAVTLLDDLEMSKQSVALTHSGSTGVCPSRTHV